jgi:Protein of unknown function (DUF3757)
MKTNIIFLSLLLSSQYAMANEPSSCPDKSEIDHNKGVYMTADSKWLGISLGDENRGDIHSFMRATYFSYENLNINMGVLDSCSYFLQSGFINMYFRDESSLSNGGLFVSLVGKKNWTKDLETLSGKESYICIGALNTDCTFERLSDDIVAENKNNSL